MLHVPSMEGLDRCGRSAHKAATDAIDDSDSVLVTVLSVLEAAECLQPLGDHAPSGRRRQCCFAFGFGSLEDRSWLADRPQGGAARDSLYVFHHCFPTRDRLCCLRRRAWLLRECAFGRRRSNV